MSFMIEVYYHAPPDRSREERISTEAGRYGGQLTYREEPSNGQSKAVCLTYEFDSLDSAKRAVDVIRSFGDHVEGPVDYGTD